LYWGGVVSLQQKEFGFAVEEPENLVKSLLIENLPRKLEILSGLTFFNTQPQACGAGFDQSKLVTMLLYFVPINGG